MHLGEKAKTAEKSAVVVGGATRSTGLDTVNTKEFCHAQEEDAELSWAHGWLQARWTLGMDTCNATGVHCQHTQSGLV